MLEAKLVKMSALKLWENNPRRNETNIEKLTHILAVHGQRSPIIVDLKTNVIYKGNATYKAITLLHDGGIENFLTEEDKKLIKGNALISTFHADVRKGMIWASFQSFPSEAAAIAYGISDNAASEWSEWDRDLLTKMLSAEPVEYKTLSGFTEKELDFFKEKFKKQTTEPDNKDPKYKVVISVPDAMTFESFEEIFNKEVSSGFVLKLDSKEFFEVFNREKKMKS